MLIGRRERKRSSTTTSSSAADSAGDDAYRRSSLDRDFWLGDCEGFRVEVAGRGVGVVEEIVFASRTDRPDLLVVRGGLFGTRSSLVSVDDIADVIPARKRVTLAPGRGQGRRGGDEGEGGVSRRFGRLAAGRASGSDNKQGRERWHTR